MKKILLGIGVGLLVLIVVGILAVSFFLDGTVKRGIETIGPRITQTTVTLDGVGLSLFSGSGSVKGLVIGNPDGYKTPHAISVGTATLALKPGSVFSDKVIIKSINVQSPEITFEGGFGGNNLSKLLANVKQATGGSETNAAPKESKSASRKIEVDDFVISKAKLLVSVTGMGGKTIPVALPEIHLSNLGTGPDGITPAELTKVVLSEIEREAVKAADSAVADLGKNATGVTKDVGKSVGDNADKIGKSIGNLFKKK